MMRDEHGRSVSQLEERPDSAGTADSAGGSDSSRDYGAAARDKGGRGTLQTAESNRRTGLPHFLLARFG